MQLIERLFGTEYLATQGELNRARMRQLVFSDPSAKRDLEQILHPLIRQDVDRQLKTIRSSYAMIVIPLLVETGAYRDLMRRVLVVDCEERIQIARTMARSTIDEAQVRAIMRTQVSRAARLLAADDVIDNSGELSELEPQVERLDLCYRTIAQAL